MPLRFTSWIIEAGKPLASVRAGKQHLRGGGDSEEMSPYGGYPDGRFMSVAKDHICLVGDPLSDLGGLGKNWMEAHG